MTTNSTLVGSAVSRGDANIWSMLVQRPGDWETILHMNTRILPVPDLDCRVRKLVWDRDVDTQWRISCGGVQSRPRPCWRLYLTPTPLEQTNGRPSVPDRTDCFGLLPLDSLGHRRWGKRDGRLYCLHCTLFCPCPWKFADNIGKIAVADRQHRARRRQRRLLWIPPELLSKQKTGPKVPDKVVRTGE